MSSYYLVIFLYAGAWAESDSVTVTTVPQQSMESCQIAGNQSKALVSGTKKEMRFVCLKSN